MGYNIYYEGIINIDRPLDDRTYKIINGLAKTRRMIWDVKKLEEDGIAKRDEIGCAGEFFFGIEGIKGKKLREVESKYVIDCNCPPTQQPGLWGGWNVTDDRMGLVWSRNEKSYSGHEWLKYIVKKILVPRGYYPSGIINWLTEEKIYNCRWHTVVEGNSVRKYKGYSSKQKEPDIDEWLQQEIDWYEKYHQEWIEELINTKVEFLHESIASSEDNTSEKYVLSFNLFIGDNVVQATYDRKRISDIRYLYKNIRNENGRIIHDEFEPNNKIVKHIEITKIAKELIEKYICETPNYLDRAVI